MRVNNVTDIRRFKGEETKESLIERMKKEKTESVMVILIDNEDCISYGWSKLSDLEALGLLEATKHEILIEG